MTEQDIRIQVLQEQVGILLGVVIDLKVQLLVLKQEPPPKEVA